MFSQQAQTLKNSIGVETQNESAVSIEAELEENHNLLLNQKSVIEE